MFSSETKTDGDCPPPLKSLESNSNGDLLPVYAATLGLRSITSVLRILSNAGTESKLFFV